MTAVDAPPRSGPLVSGCSTLEMDVDGLADGMTDARAFGGVSEPEGEPEAAGGPCDAIRQSLHDVSSARMRMYHHQCDRRLQIAARLMREREERSMAPATALRTGRGRRTAAATGPSAQWKLLRESNDIRVFRQRGPAGSNGSVMALGTVHGSLGDVMNGLYADTTREARVLHALLSRRVADARVLRVDKRASEARPFQFAGVTWTAVRLQPALGLCKLRDFLCFKKMDCFRDDDGADVGYLVLQSIDPVDDFERALHPSPSPRPATNSHTSSQSSRYVRGYMSLAVLLKRVDEDRVALFAHGELSPNGRVPPLLRDRCVADALTSLANAVRTGEAKRLTALLHSPSPPLLQARAALAAKTNSSALTSGSRPRCGVCARAVYFWDAPRACRGCWTLTCRTCRVTRPIFCSHAQHFRDAAAALASAATSSSSTTSGSRACTETFCLLCVCSVTPNAGALVNAQLLARLEKKRKRSPATAGRPSALLLRGGGSRPLSLSGSFPVLASAGDDGSSLANGRQQASSISVTSSRPESDKHQQMRLSLNPRPTKRRYDRASVGSEATSADMLEVLEHTHYAHGVDHMLSMRTDTELSSLGNASLVSFSSTDLAPSTATGSVSNALSLRRGSSSGVDALPFGSFRRLASAVSSGGFSQQPAAYHHQLSGGAGTGAPLQRRRSMRQNQQQQQQQQQQLMVLAAALQRKESATMDVSGKAKRPSRRYKDDREDEDEEEYYQKMLREVLRSTASTRSLALLSASSVSGVDVTSQAASYSTPPADQQKQPALALEQRRSSRRRRARTGRNY